MRTIVWLVRAAVFFRCSRLRSITSTRRRCAGSSATVRAPMVFIVLAAFGLGCAFGIFAMVPGCGVIAGWRATARVAPRIASAPERPFRRQATLRRPIRRAMDLTRSGCLARGRVRGGSRSAGSHRARRAPVPARRRIPKVYYKGLNLPSTSSTTRRSTPSSRRSGGIPTRRSCTSRRRPVPPARRVRACGARAPASARPRRPDQAGRDQAQYGLARLSESWPVRPRRGGLPGASRHPFDTEARLALLHLHERRATGAALAVAEQLSRAGGSPASRIAHYHCELALEWSTRRAARRR